MINKKLKAELLKKLNVTPQRLSQCIATIKQKYGPMSTPDAACVLAHNHHISLDKFVDPQIIYRIRQYIKQVQSIPMTSLPERRSSRERSKKIVKIAGSFTLNDPILSSYVVEKAKIMAERVYPIIYILENSIRELVIRVMSSTYGNNWWNAKVPKDVKDEVQDRLNKEDKLPWHGKRGAHPIYYTDMLHLDRIIANNWPDFKEIIGSREWLRQKLLEI